MSPDPNAPSVAVPAATLPYAGRDVAPIRRASPLAAFVPLAWPALALAALLLFNLLLTPGFFKIAVKDGRLYGSLIDVLKNGSPTLLLTLGMTAVIATGGIDLSVGAVMAMAGAVSVCLLSPPYGSPFVGHALSSTVLVLAAGLLTALLCCIWNGVLVAYLRLQPIVATLILMVAGRGMAQLLTNGQIPTFRPEQSPGLDFMGNGYLLGLPFQFVLAAVAFAAVLGLMRGTALGLFVESVGNNRVAARVAGVNAAAVRLACYAASGLLAGVAGLVATANLRAADVNNVGQNLELDAILSTAIGGTSLAGGRFSLIGSALGALVIQTLTTTILARGIAPETTLIAKAAIVIALCLLQSPKFRKKLDALVRRRRAA